MIGHFIIFTPPDGTPLEVGARSPKPCRRLYVRGVGWTSQPFVVLAEATEADFLACLQANDEPLVRPLPPVPPGSHFYVVSVDFD